MRALILALLLAAGAAQADTRAAVIETDPPGEAITLGRDEVLWLRIAYVTDQPVRIWARPYSGGKEVAAHSNPRTAAPWVQALRLETQARSRAEREAQASEPASAGAATLTYGLMLLVAAVVIGVPAALVWLVWKAARGELRVQGADYVPYAASALCGLVVCLAISLATGRKEAWDSSLYFSVGMPAMVLAIFAISYLFPRAAWRWTLSMALGQSIALLLGGNSLSLWPLAILAMLLFSLPQFASGYVGSWLSRRNAA